MAKVLTFSRFFPSTHPRKGEPTHFVEAILTRLGINYKTGGYYVWLIQNNPGISDVFLMKFFDSLKSDVYPKSHTIRSHKKPLREGDIINPKCWAGKPYNKTEEGYWQIKFAPDIEVKKTWDFGMDENGIYSVSGFYADDETRGRLAANDGLSESDMQFWFMPDIKRPKPFSGRIYCWNNEIEY